VLILYNLNIIYIGIVWTYSRHFLCCTDYTEESNPTKGYEPEGLVIIDYPVPRSKKYTQFKQEMSDFYFKKYRKRQKPMPDVSCCTVCIVYVDRLVVVCVVYLIDFIVSLWYANLSVC